MSILDDYWIDTENIIYNWNNDSIINISSETSVSLSDEEILDRMDIKDIEKYLRRKKLEKLENIK